MCGPLADSLFGRTLLVTLAVLAAAASARSSAQAPPDVPVATRRAVSYLVAEVPRWRREHPCYSCHNNGDGARALLAAGRRDAIGDTLGFLARPGDWQGRGQEKSSATLSTVQFAAALVAAGSNGEALEQLARAHERAARQAGLQPETRPYKPHVTIARLRGSRVDAVARYLQHNGAFKLEPFVVERFVLYSSRPQVGGGPYVIEDAYPLRGGMLASSIDDDEHW